MGKEVKIGLAVILVLLGVFGYALYSRLKAGSADSAVADKPAASKDAAKQDDTPKLSSGPAKLSSGPTKKLSSGPAKTSAPSKLASEPAKTTTSGSPSSSTAAAGSKASASVASTDRYRRGSVGESSSTASDSQDTATSSETLTDLPTRAGGTTADRYADRYGPYRASAASAIDAAAAKVAETADRAGTVVGDTARQLSRDPFGRQPAGSQAATSTDSTASLLDDVQSAASTALDDVRSRADQTAASTLDQTSDQLDRGLSSQIDKAGAALDQGTAQLRQAATSALDKASTALDEVAGNASSRTQEGSNPLRSVPTDGRNAFDAVQRDTAGDTSTSPGDTATPSTSTTSRMPRTRYDFYGDSPTTAATAADKENHNTSTTASDTPSSGGSASFRSSRLPAASSSDRYNVNPGASTASNAAAPAKSNAPGTASSDHANHRSATTQVTPLPRSADSWSGASGRTSSATTTSDSRYERANPPATSSTASSSPPPTASRTSPYSSTTRLPSSASTTPAGSQTAIPASSTPSRATVTAITPTGKSYSVEPNDNYWVISEKLYGTGNYFKALEHHNRQRFPRGDLLRTGDVIDTPTAEALTASYPSLCPKAAHLPPPRSTNTVASQRGAGGRTYVVEEGDTLFDIARYELGKATRWAEIYQLNRDQIGADFNHLRPGTRLAMPDDASSDTFTRRPSAGVQR